MSEPEQCQVCGAPDPDGDSEGTRCRACVESFHDLDGQDFVDDETGATS